MTLSPRFRFSTAIQAAASLPLLAAGTLALGGCGSSGTASTVSARQAAAIVRTTKTPPVSDLELATGSPTHQITETLVSFYRAAWQDDAERACSLFSPAGAAGFMKASRTAFPSSALPSSPCSHDMQLFSAALGDSVSNLQQSQPNVSGDILNNVGVAAITVHGDTATALAPMNVETIVNPKRIDLVRLSGRWRIAGSHSLNASNLPAILKRAQQHGALSGNSGG
jgi:hypothetical protein